MATRRQFVSATGTAAAAVAAQACGGGATGPGGDGGDGGGGGGGGGTGEVRAPLPAVGVTIEIPRVGLGEQGIAVTRLSTTVVVAVSMECTHQGCKVALPGSPIGNPICEWPGGNLNCPCHCSSYTTTGTVVNGPATRNLKTYAARIAGSEVVVTLS